MAAGNALAAVVVLACAGLAGLVAAVVWSRRQGGAGTALAGMLVALALWNACYGAELLATTASWRLALGDLKYVGIGALTPAWLTFALCWTGRERRVTRRLLLALAVEPVLVLLALAVPATHDLVRSLPPGAPDPLTAEVAVGPLFWVHAAYTDLLLIPATAALVVSLWRRSRAYELQGLALVVAVLLPWAANLLFTFSVGPFGRLDLTPVMFTVAAVLLVWGLFQQRLLRLDPLARGLLLDRMSDGVLVLDAFGHLADVNPAAAALLGAERRTLLGRAAADLLPAPVLSGGAAPVVIGDRSYEVADTPLPGRRGASAGRLLVLSDITEHARLERRLRELLAEQLAVSAQLSSSLRPAALPVVPGLDLAAGFSPAGGTADVGGDFYDVFASGAEWVFTLGDVSGKGPRAAATTASARYTLRTLALAGARPAEALRQLHAHVVEDLDDEVFLTVVHGRVRVRPDGARVCLALGGHPPPLLLHVDGRVEPVGTPGTAIGLFAEVDVVEVEVDLAAGESLFLFSDGVSEAREGSALFGEGGLSRVLGACAGRTADEVAGTVLSTVLGLPGTAPRDDVALLVLRSLPQGSGVLVPPRTASPAQAHSG